MLYFRWFGALLALTVGLPAHAQSGLGTFTRAYEPRTLDERGVWMLADEDERGLRDSKFVIRDPQLTAYLQSILCNAVGNDRCGAARIYVMRIASFNATMRPNGAMEIWSGLLLRVRDEAELAAVLSHEFAHFELRHTLASYRKRRQTMDIAAWIALLGGVGTGATQASLFGSYFAFQRDQEQEADLLGLQYLRNSAYNPQCFADIWERMMDETAASALGRKQRAPRFDRVAFFATHPTHATRVTYLRNTAGEPRGEEAEERYRASLARWMPEFLADQLKLNDFGGTEYLLGQAASSGWTPDLLFARGELYRIRGNPRDFVSAADFYRQAIAMRADFAESYRGLGLSLLRGQDAAEGKEALRQYLTLRPDASDAALISSLSK
jgi:Zn-dependent protease with chaperone function